MKQSFMLLAMLFAIKFVLLGRVGTPHLGLESGFIHFKISGNHTEVSLKWAPAVEVSYSYFEIEKSEDSLSFSIIGLVEGKTKSPTPKSYQFEDLNPRVGKSFYRIKRVDFDGSHSYSEIQSVIVAERALFHLYPGRSNEKMILELSPFLSSASFEIISTSGLRYKQEKFEGRNYQIDLSSLSSGFYLLILTTERGKTMSKKFMKI